MGRPAGRGPQRGEAPALTRHAPKNYGPLPVFDVEFSGDRGDRTARAVTLAPQPPYTEVAEFLSRHVDLVETAMNTLRYVDCALLARRITGQCLLSVGLMDDICPPSTVFAAYNAIAAPKEISVFPFGVHGVPAAHAERQLLHLRDWLRAH